MREAALVRALAHVLVGGEERGAFPRGVVPGCVLLTVINLDHAPGKNFEARRRKRMVLEE